MADRVREKEKEEKQKGERWKAALVNLTEMGSNIDSLQQLLVKKAVFVDDDTFAKASLISEQSKTIKLVANLESNARVS
ncbi:hypothetical protein J5N97_026489 [Dioscorea zingiberensis]|uniref:Uncharacterized protein n=1 Tax=Dioscorea zingiberensis TaxID=325984 RepID=A0A9D5C2E6_9LILI|nr:hypothetical protein J5N97_026489 [Dioscorea zingiberensis]